MERRDVIVGLSYPGRSGTERCVISDYDGTTIMVNPFPHHDTKNPGRSTATKTLRLQFTKHLPFGD